MVQKYVQDVVDSVAGLGNNLKQFQIWLVYKLHSDFSELFNFRFRLGVFGFVYELHCERLSLSKPSDQNDPKRKMTLKPLDFSASVPSDKKCNKCTSRTENELLQRNK